MKQQFQIGDTVKMIPDLKGGIWTAAVVRNIRIKFPHSPHLTQICYTFELAKFPFRGKPLIDNFSTIELDDKGIKRWRVKKL